MGTSTDAYLVYGVEVEEGTLYSESPCDEPEGSPLNLAYMGKTCDGIKVLKHCSDSCPEYIVCLASAFTWATRGNPREVDPAKMLRVATPEAEAKILEYCKKYEVEFTGKPGWILCSYWG